MVNLHCGPEVCTAHHFLGLFFFDVCLCTCVLLCFAHQLGAYPHLLFWECTGTRIGPGTTGTSFGTISMNQVCVGFFRLS